MAAEAARPPEFIGLARSIPAQPQSHQGGLGYWNASELRVSKLTWIRKRRKLRALVDLEVPRAARRRGKREWLS